MMKEIHICDIKQFIPSNAFPIIDSLILSEKVTFIICEPRKTFLGKYRHRPKSNANPQILICKNDNKERFLLVLLHELAHYFSYKISTFKEIKPHGKEWAVFYAQLISKFISKDVFSVGVEYVLIKYVATNCQSKRLKMELDIALGVHDIVESVRKDEVYVYNLNLGDSFKFKNRTFQILKNNKTRVVCVEKENNSKKYTFYKALRVSTII